MQKEIFRNRTVRLSDEKKQKNKQTDHVNSPHFSSFSIVDWKKENIWSKHTISYPWIDHHTIKTNEKKKDYPKQDYNNINRL